MKLVCPNCKKEYFITVDTPRIGKNVVGEYFYVCNEPLANFKKGNPFYKPKCGGYMVVDMKKLIEESLNKGKDEQGSNEENTEN